MTCAEASKLTVAMAEMTDEELAAAGKMTRAQQALAEQNRGLARTAAGQIQTDIMTFDERVAAGFVGICRAAMGGYKPELGWKFSTYAVHAARREILNEMRWLSRGKRDPSRASLCDPYEMQNYIEARPEPVPSGEREEQLRSVLATASKLPERLRLIILRRLAGRSLVTIGRELGLTKERVRQLESEARRALRVRLNGVNTR